VNISSYQSFGWDDRKYDSHWSMRAAMRQNIPQEIVWDMLDLQKGTENPTVEIMGEVQKAS